MGDGQYKFIVTHHYQNNQKYSTRFLTTGRELVDSLKVKDEFKGQQKTDKYGEQYFHVESPIYMEDDMRDLSRILDKDEKK